MYLINTYTRQLEEKLQPQNLRYAILSHTWGNDELKFEEFTNGVNGIPSERRREGFRKIWNVCRIARSNQIKYVWVDTVCIDKRSSAELSEAINSMFRWYECAHVCYVYLSDVVRTRNPDKHIEEFRESRWFTRGWTLQELLAPWGEVVFFDKFWNKTGTRTEHAELIASITGVGLDVLQKRSEISSYSVAQRMSWAAKRETTREEDMAYCLLGIFDINMPLLYGEGGKAFQRLQEEIIKVSPDQTIFAWSDRVPRGLPQSAGRYGLLAIHPLQFNEALRPIKGLVFVQLQCEDVRGKNLWIALVWSHMEWQRASWTSGPMLFSIDRLGQFGTICYKISDMYISHTRASLSFWSSTSADEVIVLLPACDDVDDSLWYAQTCDPSSVKGGIKDIFRLEAPSAGIPIPHTVLTLMNPHHSQHLTLFVGKRPSVDGTSSSLVCRLGPVTNHIKDFTKSKITYPMLVQNLWDDWHLGSCFAAGPVNDTALCSPRPESSSGREKSGVHLDTLITGKRGGSSDAAGQVHATISLVHTIENADRETHLISFSHYWVSESRTNLA